MARLTPVSGRQRRPAAPSAEARLALAEFLLASDDVGECAERALEWLGEHAAVTHALCLVVDADMARLECLAGYNTAPLRGEKFTVDLEARDHPLVQALSAMQSRVLGGHGTEYADVISTLGPSPFLTVPLYGLHGTQTVPVGLLLVRPVYGTNREVRWLAEFLGYQLLRLRASHSLSEAERRLKRERTLLYSIIDSVSDPILLTDTEGRMVVANDRAEALLASREEESEGRRRAVALNNMLFSSALGKSAVGGLDSAPREVLLVDPTDGSDLLFELLSTVARDSREGTGIVSILRNVGDLRRATQEIEENYRRLRVAEVEIRAERDRLALIIDSVADPILVTDPSGNIVLMNAPAERLFTVSEDATAEESQRVRANDANFTSFVSNLFFGAAEMRYRGGVSLVDPRTGTVIPVEAVSGKVLSERGEVSAIVTILHDRTEAIEKEGLYEQLKQASTKLEEKVRDATAELVRQNELLRRQAIQLEQASTLKSQFLASMSHELRTPLNAILGYTSLLLKGVSGEMTEAQRSTLSRIEANGRHLLSLINDVLDISRIEAGKMPLNLGEVALGQLIAEVIEEVEPLIDRLKLVVTTDVAKRLPAVRSDRQKIKQIVLNLLTNALKFTPQGSVRVSCAYSSATREIALAVTDTGIGIPPADHARIFEHFSQADEAATREYTGAGLGLWISGRLASVLGGRITLDSKLGQGSTFTLLLPVRPRSA